MILLLGISTYGYSQLDTNYIFQSRKKFSVFPIFQLYKTSYDLQLKEQGRNESIESIEKKFYTKTNLYLGFGMSFYKIGFSLLFKLPYSNIPELQNTKAFAFAGGFAYSKTYSEIKYKHYKGLQEETLTKNRDSTTISNRIEENLETKQASLMVYYIASKKFRYNAAFKNYNIQKKSTAAFVFGGGINMYNLNGDLDLVDTISNSESFLAKNTRIYSIKLLPGATGILTYKRFFISLFALAGPVYNYYMLDDTETRHQFNSTIELRSALGYNNSKFFASISFNYDNDRVVLQKNNLDISNYMLNFKIGIKLNSKYLAKIGPYL